MAEEEITWDDAISSGKYVKLETEETKKIVITNWKLEEVEKFGNKQVEFMSEVIEEDGEEITGERFFTSVSNRLKKKLRPILEGKKSGDEVKISIIKIGDKFNTNYSVKELKD